MSYPPTPHILELLKKTNNEEFFASLGDSGSMHEEKFSEISRQEREEHCREALLSALDYFQFGNVKDSKLKTSSQKKEMCDLLKDILSKMPKALLLSFVRSLPDQKKVEFFLILQNFNIENPVKEEDQMVALLEAPFNNALQNNQLQKAHQLLTLLSEDKRESFISKIQNIHYVKRTFQFISKMFLSKEDNIADWVSFCFCGLLNKLIQVGSDRATCLFDFTRDDFDYFYERVLGGLSKNELDFSSHQHLNSGDAKKSFFMASLFLMALKQSRLAYPEEKRKNIRDRLAGVFLNASDDLKTALFSKMTRLQREVISEEIERSMLDFFKAEVEPNIEEKKQNERRAEWDQFARLYLNLSIKGGASGAFSDSTILLQKLFYNMPEEKFLDFFKNLNSKQKGELFFLLKYVKEDAWNPGDDLAGSLFSRSKKLIEFISEEEIADTFLRKFRTIELLEDLGTSLETKNKIFIFFEGLSKKEFKTVLDVIERKHGKLIVEILFVVLLNVCQKNAVPFSDGLVSLFISVFRKDKINPRLSPEKQNFIKEQIFTRLAGMVSSSEEYKDTVETLQMAFLYLNFMRKQKSKETESIANEIEEKLRDIFVIMGGDKISVLLSGENNIKAHEDELVRILQQDNKSHVVLKDIQLSDHSTENGKEAIQSVVLDQFLPVGASGGQSLEVMANEDEEKTSVVPEGDKQAVVLDGSISDPNPQAWSKKKSDELGHSTENGKEAIQSVVLDQFLSVETSAGQPLEVMANEDVKEQENIQEQQDSGPLIRAIVQKQPQDLGRQKLEETQSDLELKKDEKEPSVRLEGEEKPVVLDGSISDPNPQAGSKKESDESVHSTENGKEAIQSVVLDQFLPVGASGGQSLEVMANEDEEKTSVVPEGDKQAVVLDGSISDPNPQAGSKKESDELGHSTENGKEAIQSVVLAQFLPVGASGGQSLEVMANKDEEKTSVVPEGDKQPVVSMKQGSTLTKDQALEKFIKEVNQCENLEQLFKKFTELTGINSEGKKMQDRSEECKELKRETGIHGFYGWFGPQYGRTRSYQKALGCVKDRAVELYNKDKATLQDQGHKLYGLIFGAYRYRGIEWMQHLFPTQTEQEHQKAKKDSREMKKRGSKF